MNNNPTISTLPSVPTLDSYTPLAEHQSQTPSTFFGAKAVLYASFVEADVLLSKQDISNWPAWSEIMRKTESSIEAEETRENAGTNGTSGEQPNNVEAEQDIDTIETKTVYRHVCGFITSESVVLFNDSASAALTIPYPSISLHATQRVKRTSLRPYTYSTPAPPAPEGQPTDEVDETSLTQALYLQLDLGNPFTRDPSLDEDAGETVSLLIVPTNALTVTEYSISVNDAYAHGNVKLLFESLSKCADLHPDPANTDSDEEGGEGGAAGGGLAALMGMAGGGMPGSGGWITSENAHEFERQFGDEEGDDEEGGEEGDPMQILGPGAGVRRAREDGDAEDEGDADGDGKWQRTS